MDEPKTKRKSVREATTTRADVVTALRQIADCLEHDDAAEVVGEITLTRTVMPTREAIERWIAMEQVFPEPIPQTQTFTLQIGQCPLPASIPK